MNHGFKFIGITLLGVCLFLTGCPDKAITDGDAQKTSGDKVETKQSDEPTSNKPTAIPANIEAAIALLEKNEGTYEKNASGVVVAVNLGLSDVVNESSEEGQNVVALFDAINKLVDLEKLSFEGPGIADFTVTRLTNLKNIKTVLFKNTNITTESLDSIAKTMTELTQLSV